MLGAILVGAAALWWSDLSPQAGQPYIAVAWTGTGQFDCASHIGRQQIDTTVYHLGDTSFCVVHVPVRTSGRKLGVEYEVVTREGLRTTAGHGTLKPKLIR